jgi:hypothetical protein
MKKLVRIFEAYLLIIKITFKLILIIDNINNIQKKNMSI